MIRKKTILRGLVWATALLPMIAYAENSANAAKPQSALEATKRAAESQVRNTIEPILNKYCHEECKLMSVNASVDVSTPEHLAPGFDDIDPKGAGDLTATSAEAKILIDEKIGPVSKSKILDLVQQYMETLDYPVKVSVQTAGFPSPVGSAEKLADLREKVTKQFRSTLETLFTQFCPNQCVLTDFELDTEPSNIEESQYGSTGEYVGENGVAIHIRDVSGTILIDDSISATERANILEMAKLKTNSLKNVTLTAKSMKFPKSKVERDAAQLLASNGEGRAPSSVTDKSEQNSADTTTNSNTKAVENKESKISETNQHQESNQKTETYNRIEKIERVESGDAVQAELQKFKVYGLVFACSILSILIFLALASWKQKQGTSTVHTNTLRGLGGGEIDPITGMENHENTPKEASTERANLVAKRYEIERLVSELMSVFAQQPKVAKQVFSRIISEEGIETTAAYVHIFGESVVMDMLRDPSLQSDMNELMEFYAKNPIELEDDEKLDLLKKLHNRTVAGKLVVMGSRSSQQYDFLADMDGTQILELIRNESLTVKSIILTQCDATKRSTIYSQMEPELKLKLMTELSRIDYLPREYIYNVATALKRKRQENPKLNTEALPGSEVLVTLLERTEPKMQQTVMRELESTSPESARTVKGKLVSLDTLCYLRDGQLLEVVLSLKHEELLQFLKGAPTEVRTSIFAKSLKDLVVELEEELAQVSPANREAYFNLERKVLNRMKMMANEGLINLVETNERMFAQRGASPFLQAGAAGKPETTSDGVTTNIKKVAGW